MPFEPPPSCSRRTLLAQALAVGVLGAFSPLVAFAAAIPIENFSRLYTIEVARVETPADAAAVVQALRDWPGKVAIGGGRYSMGGQVAIAGGLHLDMRRMNKLVWLRAPERQVRVQAGMLWRDLQDVLDPHHLSVRTMQSFSNFTVGGSVSVNCHGRYVGHGPISHSLRALQLVLADGRIVEASRQENAELFAAAVGGYGAIGVITEVELDLDENKRMERRIEPVPLAAYPAFFADKVLADRASVMHNADLLAPLFDAPMAITWRETDKPLTRTNRLVARGQSYRLKRQALWALTELPGASGLREPATEVARRLRPEVAWRNHEASLDVAQLEPLSRRSLTYVLNEYFVPPRRFESFVLEMGRILRRYDVGAVNVSIRHSPADTVSLLPWAREEVFSFVLFYRQGLDQKAQQVVGEWTRELIDATLKHEGRYYLPYQLHATQEQFERAYPEAAKLRQLKARVDPQGRFSNSLWQKYL